ncbi:phosphatase PAP2 family protein [Rhodobacter maris]|uniref:Membrane-associated phospholipid phosphatase n=1 Tax=Rhodobacter maris TaxID=446682 RepID=A0A285RJ78_9RHOB|nr:phosphatase PAP2 family protein [Rhodobacter maris]SOB94175.1 membrane-associated phospholipid phosphatase [Rhodobacter maris]
MTSDRPIRHMAPFALPRPSLPRQSALSRGSAIVIGIFLVMVLLDPPVRALSQQLDPALRDLLRGLTRLGNAGWPLGSGLAALAVVQLLLIRETGRRQVALRRMRAAVLFVLGAVAGSGVLSSLAKNIIGRARPTLEAAGEFDFVSFAFQAGHASFPSGHATTAMAMMVALALILPRHALGLLTAGGLIALTRALIGMHWMSDVLVGAGLGTLFTLALSHQLYGARNRDLVSRRVATLCFAALRDRVRETWFRLSLPERLGMRAVPVSRRT